MRRSAMCVVGAALLSACYDYAPPAGVTPVPGAEVRLVLTDLGSAQNAGLIGAGVEALDGHLDRADRDSVVVRATATQLRSGDDREWSGERIALPAAAVGSLQVRRLNRPHTFLAVAAGVAVAVAAIIVGRNVAGGGDEGPSGQPPTGM